MKAPTPTPFPPRACVSGHDTPFKTGTSRTLALVGRRMVSAS